MSEKGFGQVTIEAVAAKSGVGKPTIYRHWANAGELVMEALMSDLPEGSSPKQGQLLASLRSQLQRLVSTFATTRGRQITMALAASDPESEMTKAFRHRVILSSRAHGRALIEAAVERGEIAAPHDVDVVLDMIYAPLFFRLLVGHLPLDHRFSDGIVRHVEAMLTWPNG